MGIVDLLLRHKADIGESDRVPFSYHYHNLLNMLLTLLNQLTWDHDHFKCLPCPSHVSSLRSTVGRP
jgi:hypothetical protein